MQTTIHQRINAILKNENLSIKKFAEKIKVPQTTISNYFTRGTEPSIMVIQQIINSFEYINVEWLVTGIGEMIKKDSIVESETKNKTTIEILDYLSKLLIENEQLKIKIKEYEDIFNKINIAASPKTKYGKD